MHPVQRQQKVETELLDLNQSRDKVRGEFE
jgi:hypothetical protein